MEYQEPLFPEDRESLRKSRVFGTPEFRQAYSRYTSSGKWKKLAGAIKTRAKGRCERCGVVTPRLSIHHLTYDRFQHELLSDLQALCASCHEAADREREQDNLRRYQQAGEEARYAAAQDTYFTKKYGEDWHLHYDAEPERMSEEFDTWLERKREQDDAY